MEELRIVPDGVKDTPAPETDGDLSRCVWGYVYLSQQAIAAYFVHWTVGRVPEFGADVDLIIGRWGDEASAIDRVLVSLQHRFLVSGGPGFGVVDATNRPAATAVDVVGKALTRSEVMGQPIGSLAFAIVDALLVQDARIAELLGE